MSGKGIVHALFWTLILVLMPGCAQQRPARSDSFSDLALRGKKVFEARDCGRCHYVGDENVESDAPDLTTPLIAVDSSLVQTHLRFVRETQMPPVDLTGEEIDLLSYYIADLHRSKHATVPPDEADASCPICYAPVSIAQARANKLWSSFLGEKYYFECRDCLEVFRKYPVAFRELYRQHELENRAGHRSLK